MPFMAVRRFHEEGSDPVKQFSDKSIESTILRELQEEGMVPVNEF